ncbi:alanine racemase [Rhizobium rhizosphaerae]|uniref:Alanine racemase n=1 Tax=Xaviernesmea rhizosphaerae TaxID=1672749 RepID=A0A1Q9ADC9_9HYPH|nr:alanine racemase [Xaviernesmea rhizosphaerae]OLP52911.1 alanine racemase [Xaviernesmea rhizosphaerae]
MDGFLRHDRELEADEAAPGLLTIDLAALARNHQALAARVAPAACAAVVKADAYGLGAVPVTRALQAAGCRHFFVAQSGEADALLPVLDAGSRIYVLNGLLPGAEAACAARGVVPVINSLEQLDRWTETAREAGRRLPALLQFDTGMSRLGLPLDSLGEVVALVSAVPLDILFVMTHLASADEPDHVQNGEQRAALARVRDAFPDIPISFANSGGVFLGAAFHGALVRPGIATYGGAPVSGRANPMEPVVRLDLAVVQTRTVPAGARIGYSGAYVTPAPRRLATLAAGYADGIPRALSDRGAVFFEGVRLPILGRVSMDSMTVDISALPEGTLTLGSQVEFIGPHQTLEEIAAQAGTIAYEILTRLGQRYRRIHR